MQNDGEADANKLASADAVAESLEALKVSPDGVYKTEKSGGTKETVVPATMEGVAEGAAEGVKEEGYMTDEDYEVDEEGFYEQVLLSVAFYSLNAYRSSKMSLLFFVGTDRRHGI